MSWADKPVTPWPERGRVPVIDGMRGVAILAVLAGHAMVSSNLPRLHLLHELGSRLGTAGVDLFFIISGFLITHLLLRESAEVGHVSLRAFYARRCRRILPAYLFYLCCLSASGITGSYCLNTKDLIKALTYTVNFDLSPPWEIGHIWSLCVEEHFYLLWPAAFLLLGPRGAFRLAIACVLLTPAVRLLLGTYCSDYYSPARSTPARMDVIAMGCCLAFVVSYYGVNFFRKQPPPAVGVALGATALALILANKTILNRFEWVHTCFGKTVDSLSITCLFWLTLATCQSPLGRLFSNRVITSIGVFSYSLYLWQQPFLNPHRVDILCSFPINVIVALAFASVSYFLVEAPFLRLKLGYSHGREVARQVLCQARGGR